MTRSYSPLVLMLDEGAPLSCGTPFSDRGHRVIKHHDVLAPSAKDQLVAFTAIKNEAVLLATDRDMRQLVKRFGSGTGGERYGKLNLIFVNCSEVLAAKRVEHSMDFIEHEWRVACQKRARRMWLEIGQHHLCTFR